MPFRQEILDIVLSELANSSTNAVGTDRNMKFVTIAALKWILSMASGFVVAILLSHK